MNTINPAAYKFAPPRGTSELTGHPMDCGCPSCLNNPCANDYVASFDLEGNFLVPASGERFHETYIFKVNGEDFLQPSGTFMAWENEAAPSSVHPIPCYYTVTVEGTENNTVNESWCQQCEDLNGTYYAIRDTEPYTLYNIYQPDRIINIPLCTDNNPVSYCYLNNLEVYLSIGTEEYAYNIEYADGLNPLWLTTDSSIAPHIDDDPNYIYRNCNKEKEGRPQLYIYGIVHLKFDPPTDDEFGGTSYFENNCLTEGYWFVRTIGEFNGDYQVIRRGTRLGEPTYYIQAFSDIDEGACNRKVYHGDFDGRNLTFVVYGQDLININQPIETKLCNFDGMTITVAPLDPDNKGYVGQYDYDLRAEIIQDCDCDSLFTTWSDWVSIKGIKGGGWLKCAYYLNEDYPDNITNCECEASGGGLLPQKMSVTFHDIVSTNPLPLPSATIDTCNNCEWLNQAHRLVYENPSSATDYAAVIHTSGSSYTEHINYTYKLIFDESICCNCEEDYSYIGPLQYNDNNEIIDPETGELPARKDICIYGILLHLEYKDTDEYYNPLEEPYHSIKTYVISDHPAFLAIHEGRIYNKRYLELDDLTNLTLVPRYYNPYFVAACDFSESYVTLNLPSPDEFECLNSTCDCKNCVKKTTPEDILLDIPNGWETPNEDCFFQIHGEYILDRTLYCYWRYREEGYFDNGFGYDSHWWIQMDLQIIEIEGSRTFDFYDCTNRYRPDPYTHVTYEDVMLVYLKICFNVPTKNRYVFCPFCLHFGKPYPFDEWGTKIQCDDPISSTLGNRYIDCAFDQTELFFMGFECTWGWGMYDFYCDNECIDWGGDSVFITAL